LGECWQQWWLPTLDQLWANNQSGTGPVMAANSGPIQRAALAQHWTNKKLLRGQCPVDFTRLN